MTGNATAMQDLIRRNGKPLLAAVLVVLVGACNGIGQEARDGAAEAAEAIQQIRRHINVTEADLGLLQIDARTRTCVTLNEARTLISTLESVKKRAASAAAILTNTIQPLIADDKAGTDQDIIASVSQVQDAKISFERSLAPLDARIQSIKDIMKDTEAKRAQFLEMTRRLDAAINEPIPSVKSARWYFPDRESDIRDIYAPVERLIAESQPLVAQAKLNYDAAISGGRADCGAIIDDTARLKEILDEIEQRGKTIPSLLDELYRLRIDILADLRATSGLSIERRSWDAFLKAPTIHVLTFPFPYPGKEIRQAFSSLADGAVIAKIETRGGDAQALPDPWRGIIHEPRREWPDGDNTAEFVFKKQDSVYQIRLLTLAEHGFGIGGWQDVDRDRFMQLLPALGMEISSKRIGEFEAEAVDRIVPPGMSLIDDPRYGAWAQPNANRGENIKLERIWQWGDCCRSLYSVFSPDRPILYTPRDYKAWHAHGTATPYFGPTEDGMTFGTVSRDIQDSADYGKSDFLATGTAERYAGILRSLANTAP